MRFESIIPFRRETESLRPDQRILSTSGYREVPARHECRRVARRNTRSAVETDRVVAGLNRIASSPAERINPLSSCRPCGGEASALTRLERQWNRVVIDGAPEVVYAAR